MDEIGQRRGLWIIAGGAALSLVAGITAAFVVPVLKADSPRLTPQVTETHAVAAPKPIPLPLVVTPSKPTVNYAVLKPNEIGYTPVLMYHSTGDHTEYHGHRFDLEGLNIRPESFRKQLQMMYEAGWYPVNLCDLVRPGLSVPAGKTPVVLTFDDARASQFRYLKNGAIDPDCFVGMMVSFHKKHPDFPLAGTFFVLPYSKYNPTPFGQHESEMKKLAWLTDNGFEIANHSTSHRMFSRLGAKDLQWEIATCARYFQTRNPKAQMCTVALPYGIRPRGRALLQLLMNDGTPASPYTNRCIVLAAGNVSYAPMDKRFDPLLVTRIGSQPGNIETWIKRLRKDNTKSHWKPYVSDGDSNTLAVPKPLAKYVVEKRLGTVKMLAYETAAPKPIAPKVPTVKTAKR